MCLRCSAITHARVPRRHAGGTLIIGALDQLHRWRQLALDYVADRNLDVALAVLASVRLRRFTPSAVEQRDARGDARSVGVTVLRNAAELLHGHVGPLTRQAPDIDWCSSHLRLTRPLSPVAPAWSLDRQAPPCSPPA